MVNLCKEVSTLLTDDLVAVDIVDVVVGVDVVDETTVVRRKDQKPRKEATRRESTTLSLRRDRVDKAVVTTGVDVVAVVDVEVVVDIDDDRDPAARDQEMNLERTVMITMRVMMVSDARVVAEVTQADDHADSDDDHAVVHHRALEMKAVDTATTTTVVISTRIMIVVSVETHEEMEIVVVTEEIEVTGVIVVTEVTEVTVMGIVMVADLDVVDTVDTVKL